MKSIPLTLLCAIGLWFTACGSRASLQRNAAPHAPRATAVTPREPGQDHTTHGSRLSEWRDLTPMVKQGTSWPAASEDCAMIYDNVQRRMLLFGGKDDHDQNLGEMWALDPATYLWQKLEVEGDSPPPSEDHVAIFDPIGYRMILHGGEDGLTTNKTWSFDLERHRWRDMTDAAAPAREDHSAIYDSRAKRMVIFGGRNTTGTVDYINIWEIWALDLDPASPNFEKWQDLTVAEHHAPGRSDHAAVFDSLKNRMVIYGGWDKDKKEYLGDTWSFSFDQRSWTRLKTKKSFPPKRRHVVSAYDARRKWFIICGGYGEEGYLNDVWAFDLARDVWINITPGPQPRLDHQAIYDPARQGVIIYGGDARLGTKFHDLWELQIAPEGTEEVIKAVEMKQ